MDILIGTRNEYKVGEMQYLLEKISNVKIHFLKDTDINIDIDENQETLEDNAKKNAIEIPKLTDVGVLKENILIKTPFYSIFI